MQMGASMTANTTAEYLANFIDEIGKARGNITEKDRVSDVYMTVLGDRGGYRALYNKLGTVADAAARLRIEFDTIDNLRDTSKDELNRIANHISNTLVGPSFLSREWGTSKDKFIPDYAKKLRIFASTAESYGLYNTYPDVTDIVASIEGLVNKIDANTNIPDPTKHLVQQRLVISADILSCLHLYGADGAWSASLSMSNSLMQGGPYLNQTSTDQEILNDLRENITALVHGIALYGGFYGGVNAISDTAQWVSQLPYG